MPEAIEVEIYKKIAERAAGQKVAGVEILDDNYLRGEGTEKYLRLEIVNKQVLQVRRHGKLLLLDFDRSTLGIRFGMTGRLVANGVPAIEALLYTTNLLDSKYERFVLHFANGLALGVSDPRRFGNVELNPNEKKLGPDAYTITSADLARALTSSRATIKSQLLNQTKIAGIGNLLCDEILWRSGISPKKEARLLSKKQIEGLAKVIRDTIKNLEERGGSHLGDLQKNRQKNGVCPIEKSVLVCQSLAGRTTWWCPTHQV
ncbi:MAG: DNA-formamidopyrimidine glycosylase family protein [Actinomycetota bacterium]|nr:DNA-formamidopyrimidine glycosylase family protein [Actinomycetota bacterium]